MIETLTALLLAHVLADFVFQTDWMIANKRRMGGMAAHVAVVGLCAFVVTGTLAPVLLALVAAHLVIDLAKTWSGRHGLTPFLADQAAHFATLAAVAALFPGLWAEGLWGGGTFGPISFLPSAMALVAGLILATRAGGFAIGILMAPWVAASPQGLPNGGRTIGMLERALIFLLILTGQAGAIGFLIAAKSVLRFGTIGDDRPVSEYVIIGTLASFGWAFAVATLTLLLLGHLPPLGIPDLSH